MQLFFPVLDPGVTELEVSSLLFMEVDRDDVCDNRWLTLFLRYHKVDRCS